MSHHTDAIVIHCIDYRFQEFIDPWLNDHVGYGHYDRAAIAGAVFDFDVMMKQIGISDRLHHIKKVILLNHEDCGAYGSSGTYERHLLDLSEAKRKIEAQYPHLQVDTYYIHLDGTFENTEFFGI